MINKNNKFLNNKINSKNKINKRQIKMNNNDIFIFTSIEIFKVLDEIELSDKC